MALTLEQLQFELERGSKLFKSTTTMPDGSAFGFNNDPNKAIESNTDAEFLLYHSPIGTGYMQDNGVSWQKVEGNPGGLWDRLSKGSASGSDKNLGISEYAVASATDDKTLHMEDWSVLVDERGRAILFETILESDELSSAIEDILLLEGDVALVLSNNNQPIEMKSHDGMLNVFRDYVSKTHEVRQAWASYSYSMGYIPSVWMEQELIPEDRPNVVIGPNDLENPISFLNPYILIPSNCPSSFEIYNTNYRPWGTDNTPTIVVMPDTVIKVDLTGERYNISRTYQEDGRAVLTILNKSTGGSYAVYQT